MGNIPESVGMYGAKIAYVKRYVEYASPEISKKIKNAETSGKTQLNPHSNDSIPQSTEKSTENVEKIDFSEELTTLSDLRKDNERLRKQLAHWKNETKTTDKPTVRRDDVEKLSRRLVRDYHLTVSAEEVTNIVEPLANLLAKNEDAYDTGKFFICPCITG